MSCRGLRKLKRTVKGGGTERERKEVKASEGEREKELRKWRLVKRTGKKEYGTENTVGRKGAGVGNSRRAVGVEEEIRRKNEHTSLSNTVNSRPRSC